MSDRKKRILMVNEASVLSTGYANYGRELFTHLKSTDQFELAELACYITDSDPNDQRWRMIPWKVYCNMPNIHDQNEVNIYNSNNINQFGEWKFEYACLDFQPDIVIDIRDPYMHAFEIYSPFRKNYNLAIMSTVDSLNQEENWLYDMTKVDRVLCYTDWSKEVLEKEGGGLIPIHGVASPCVDLNTFKPIMDKKTHKDKFGIKSDSIIIGTVMRNQKRKLYPDLFESFKEFLHKAPEDLAKKTFLYVHAAFPDLGYDFPRLLKKMGLSSKVMFTYCCWNCGCVFPKFYSDVRVVCPKCHGANSTFPTTQRGVDRNVLSAVYNLFDLYVQYSICEGFGIPLIEAAACGVPVLGVEYSGMKDVVHKLKGGMIKINKLFCEQESGLFRAIPDNNDLVEKMLSFFTLPESMRMKKSFETRKFTEKHYDWNKTLKVWIDCFDQFTIRNGKETWGSQPRIINVPTSVPDHLTDYQFVAWALANILGKPELVGSYFHNKLNRDLMLKAQQTNMGGNIFADHSMLGMKPNYMNYDRNNVIQQLTHMVNHNNHWERLRGEKINRGEIYG